MSIYFNSTEADLFIPESNFNAATLALKKAIEDEMIGEWIDREPALVANNFETIMDAVGYSMFDGTDDNGEYGCTDLWLNRSNLGDDEEIFRTLAPFMKDGSYIQFRDEYGDEWRYCSENGQLKILECKKEWI